MKEVKERFGITGMLRILDEDRNVLHEQDNLVVDTGLNLMAKLFGFVPVVYFEIDREERELPKIKF